MKLIVANWKMQLGSCASVDLAEALVKAKRSKDAQVVLCPSFTAIDAVGQAIAKSPTISLGAQNVFYEAVGAYTGEISPLHLGELGVQYVLIGHSERRALGETNVEVNKKVIVTLLAGLTPIICVGETRKGRKGEIEIQVRAALKGLKTRHREQLFFAYEPSWAIGTGKAARPSDAAVVHERIRRTATQSIKGIKETQIHVLYGGSVDGKNAAAFLREDQIDGLLVGGASLGAKSFLSVINAA